MHLLNAYCRISRNYTPEEAELRVGRAHSTAILTHLKSINNKMANECWRGKILDSTCGITVIVSNEDFLG